MPANMLKHYTELGQHHRHKLSFLAGIYLGIGQILIFTPPTIFAGMKTNLFSQDQIIPDIWLFGGSLIALISLVTVGILHHLANLVTYATLRLNYERRYLVADIKSIAEKWEREFEAQLRTHFSLSKWSAGIAATLAAVLWSLVTIRIQYMIRYLFGPTDKVHMFVGAFFILQAAILIFYGVVVASRGRRFYQARKLLKCVEIAKTDAEFCQCLAGSKLTVQEEDVNRYRKGNQP